MIIGQYFVECIIVLISDTAAVFDFRHILCGQFTSVIEIKIFI